MRIIILLLALLSGCSIGCPKPSYEEARCQIAEQAVNSYKNQLNGCKLELQICRMR